MRCWVTTRRTIFKVSIPSPHPLNNLCFPMKIYLTIMRSQSKNFFYHLLHVRLFVERTHQCGDSPCDHADLPKEKVTRVSIVYPQSFWRCRLLAQSQQQVWDGVLIEKGFICRLVKWREMRESKFNRIGKQENSSRYTDDLRRSCCGV